MKERIIFILTFFSMASFASDLDFKINASKIGLENKKKCVLSSTQERSSKTSSSINSISISLNCDDKKIFFKKVSGVYDVNYFKKTGIYKFEDSLKAAGFFVKDQRDFASQLIYDEDKRIEYINLRNLNNFNTKVEISAQGSYLLSSRSVPGKRHSVFIFDNVRTLLHDFNCIDIVLRKTDVGITGAANCSGNYILRGSAQGDSWHWSDLKLELSLYESINKRIVKILDETFMND